MLTLLQAEMWQSPPGHLPGARGPPTAAIAGPTGNPPPDSHPAAARAGPSLLDACRCPGDSAPDPPGSQKEGKLRTDVISKSPLKTHHGAAPTRTNAVAPDVRFLFPLFFLLWFVWLHWVLAMACKVFNSGQWDLVPWPRTEPLSTGCTESWPLDHQGRPPLVLFKPALTADLLPGQSCLRC